jgi:colanic acid/amylovoran biosynthesis glycosyltransferase
MRILYITSSLPHGKGEAFVIPEIEELLKRGHEVLLVPMYPRGPVLHGDGALLLDHAVVRPLLSAEILAGALTQLWSDLPGTLRALGRLFKSRSASILLKNLAVYPKGLWLARLLQRYRPDHVHVHWAATSATLGLVAAGLSDVPWSITAHRFDIVEDNLLDLKAREACFVRAISDRGARELRAFISSPSAWPSVLHMGVYLPPLEDRERGFDCDEPRIVTPANLLEVKGHRYLIDAVKILEDRSVYVHADLAGLGPERENLERRVEELGLQNRVSFLGAVPHQKLLSQLAAGRWDMLVLPSVITPAGEQEGIPVALIEALGCQVPAISTSTGGIPELFEDIAEAPLVSPRDPEALAGAIERMLQDPSWRERLVAEGYAKVEESFSIEGVVEELISRFVRDCGGEQ